MSELSQPVLLEIPEQPVTERPAVRGAAKLRTVDRKQTMLRPVCVEDLIAPDHKARAIWQLVEAMDMSRFTEPLRTAEGSAGRPAWDPCLLVSVWVYAYSEGIGSAREIEREMRWEPGLQWLSGMAVVNHHTLSDFRVEHKAALDQLFAELLTMMESAGMLNLEQVMHDGTRIRCRAGADSFRREKTLNQRLEQARELVEQMGDPRAEDGNRRQAAQKRAARQQLERLEAARKELDQLQAQKQSETEKAAVRVSLQEPEARLMKHGDNAIAPSYNAQITTESKNKIIVGAHLSQCGSDVRSLLPAIEVVAQNTGSKPKQVVVDGGFISRQNIIGCAEQNIDLAGPMPDPAQRSAAAMKSLGIEPGFGPEAFRVVDQGAALECPGGCRLEPVRKTSKRGDRYQQYRARKEDCAVCVHRPQCRPQKRSTGRMVNLRKSEQADVAAFRRKMNTPEYQAICRRRGEVAEFPNAWIKDKLGLRKFRLSGMARAGCELLWVCLTYNVMQFIRLICQPGLA